MSAIEMARRIAATCPGPVLSPRCQSAMIRGECDDWHGVQAALSAIQAVQRLDAELVKWSCMVPPDGGSPTDEEREAVDSIATAIMAGGHYR